MFKKILIFEGIILLNSYLRMQLPIRIIFLTTKILSYVNEFDDKKN